MFSIQGDKFCKTSTFVANLGLNLEWLEKESSFKGSVMSDIGLLNFMLRLVPSSSGLQNMMEVSITLLTASIQNLSGGTKRVKMESMVL